jgi:hypothetical protein
MTEKTYTESETMALCVRAVEIALAKRPIPSQVTTREAADMLKVSTRTIERWNPPRVGGRIPYAWVLQHLQV